MKKILLLLIVGSFSFVHLQAQDKKFHFGLTMQPKVSYRYLHAEQDWQKRIFDSIERPKLTYTIGFFSERHLSNKIKARLGVNLMTMGRNSIKQSFNGVVILGSSADLLSYFTISHNFYYIEIPIDIEYHLDKNNHLAFDLGISPVINIRNTTTQVIDTPEGKQTNTIKATSNSLPAQKVGAAVKIGIGYNVPIFKKMTLEILPAFQIFVTPFIKPPTPNNEFLYSGNLQFSLSI